MKQLKNDFLFYSIVLAGYVIFSILIMNAYFLRSSQQALSGSGSYFPNIIIDAGHGGIDSGAIGIDNVLEKDINLSIALNLRDLLKASGFNVKMTRESDISIHNDDSATIRGKKVSDLNNRLKMINADSNNLLISIHQNKFEDSKYKGAQVFYSKNNSLSKELAQSIRSSFKALLQKDNNREIKPSPSGVFILNKSQVPSVIIECGFLSNQEDVSNLNNESYQKKVAFSIYCGFIDYWRKS